MPTTVAGTLFFLLLLTPGICYVARLERGERPDKSSNVSAFRETVSVVVASLVALVAATLVFAVIRVLLPHHSPDVGELIRDRDQYFRDNYAYVSTWSLALLLIACASAYVAAHFDVMSWASKKLLPATGNRNESAWWTAFEWDQAKDLVKYVYCHLNDGTVIAGGLGSYNTSPDETEDREIEISAPYFVREQGQDERIFQDGAELISARRLRRMRVEYMSEEVYQQTCERPLLRVSHPDKAKPWWSWFFSEISNE